MYTLRLSSFLLLLAPSSKRDVADRERDLNFSGKWPALDGHEDRVPTPRYIEEYTFRGRRKND